MYEAFYGLSSKPFQLNPDPNFYFGSKQHRRAKAYLEYGVSRNDGFIVITGEIGAGKTTVLRGLLDSLADSDVIVGQLVTTQLDAEDTLRMVAAAFGLPAKDVPKAELLASLEAFLLSHTSQGRRCLLVVDEAQNLTPRAVEELRMLSNFQLGSQALLQSFLVGQPEFRKILQRPEMEQFRQRVAAACHIGPLDEGETRLYIEHRLKRAGANGKPDFEPAAFVKIHEASRGIPRRVNSICDRLLLLGFMEGRTHLNPKDVDDVVREFSEEAHFSSVDPHPAIKPFNGSHERTWPLVDLELPLDSGETGFPDQLSARLGALSLEQQSERLQRLEQSLLRLEQINLRTLSMLQELVHALRRAPEQGGS